MTAIGYVFRRTSIALFGILPGRIVAEYLRAVGLVMFFLLMVAWTIDLARNFPSIRAASQVRDGELATLLFPYLLHRGVDIVTRLLPMACFFGVFLAEITRRLRLESIILAAAGFTPLRLIAALLWFALILGTLQGMLESRWRPAAVLAQVQSGLGTYAIRYRRDWLRRPTWFVEDNLALKAEIRRTNRPELRNLLVFDGIRQKNLTQVIAAEHAFPLSEPFVWRLENVRIWDPGTESRTPVRQESLDLRLDLIPQQLSFFGVQEFNIPSESLRILAGRTQAPNAPGIQTAVWRRRTAWLLPGTFALLAIALARLAFQGRLLVLPRLIFLAAVGYIAVVSAKVLWELGSLGTVPAPFAVLGSTGVALGLALLAARVRV